MAKQAGRGTSHGPRKNNQLTNGHQTQNDAYTNNSNIVQIGGFKGAMNSTASHQASLNNSAILPYQNNTYNAYNTGVRGTTSGTRYGGEGWIPSGKKQSLASVNLKNGMFI